MIARKYTQQLHTHNFCIHQKARASTCLNNMSINMSVTIHPSCSALQKLVICGYH